MTKKTQTSGRNFRGNARPRLTLLAAGVSLALSPFGNAWADSATGTDTSVSNAMNQGIAAGPAKVDAELDLKRSPAGILYGYDNILPQPRRKTGDGWEYRGDVELGGIGSGGDETNPFYRRYRDLDSGFYLHHVRVLADKPKDGSFVDLDAGSVARDDQYYSLTFGRYNSWKVKAYFNETPSVSTNTFRSLWSGMGSGYQSLVGLTPGGLATPAATQPTRSPPTRRASRPSRQMVAVPSNAMVRRWARTLLWVSQETGVSTRAVSGGWSAAGASGPPSNAGYWKRCPWAL